MTIRFSEPPASSRLALEQGITSLESPVPGVSFLKAEAPAWTMPHEIFHLGLDAIESHRGVGAAESVAWRYLRETGGTTAADVQPRADHYRFAGLTEGPFVRAFSDALQRFSVTDDTDYEPRLLQIPALYIVALWLKDRRSAGDLFVPLAPANSSVDPDRVYTSEQFEAALEEATSRRAGGRTGESGTEAP